MTTTFHAFAAHVQQLHQTLSALEPLAASAGTPLPVDAEWFELLENKLLPQLDLPPLLIVAIVGGTNIGKSAVFNHIAGEVASASTPLAAGTKHPVCLVPADLADSQLLERLFEPFQLCPWHSSEDPLDDTPENRLYWRVGEKMPPKLLLIDAPDVDSDMAVNWQRARAIRQTADVLVAVLTQQKYNDAAVKQFFRAAVEAEKPIVIIFNQCDIEADRDYWPLWLRTFCEHTGARPELVYLAPYDRRAAVELRLPFYEANPDKASLPPHETNVRDDLAALHFDAIKIQTFRGAVHRILDDRDGAPAYLRSIRASASDFEAAAEALSVLETARVAWPSLPASVLVDEMRSWWDRSRQPWSRNIHGFYRTIGRGVMTPLRLARDAMLGPQTDPIVVFQQQERLAILSAVEEILDELERLAQVGNDTLRPRLASLLSGHARAELLTRVEKEHASLPAVDQDYREFLESELNQWRRSNPRAVRFLQSLDHVAALARPAISIGLFFTGLHFAGDFVGQAAAQAASTTAGHLATEAAIAGGIAGGGEAIVSSTGEGVRQAAGRLFLRLQSRYAEQRASWLAQWLERELLGELLADLRCGASLPDSEAFQKVAQSLDMLSAASQA